mmetsp:Transcript_4675/g.12208  ORF Transcript_4675/g.12208 Transcript_4675/m.12208 type:complete len:265 (-) Transcript_4675:420-1214(-)
MYNSLQSDHHAVSAMGSCFCSCSCFSPSSSPSFPSSVVATADGDDPLCVLEAGCRSMIMTVMLSLPMPCVSLGSWLMMLSSISIPISSGVRVSMRLRTYCMACSLERQSQIPSQARMMNSSSPASSSCTISGCAVIIWSAGSMLGTCLYFKSPIDLERLRFPLTRPKWLMKPPALVILARSTACCGLWSKLNGCVLPPARHNTARESPALATVSVFPVMSATMAVQPAWIGWSGRLQIILPLRTNVGCDALGPSGASCCDITDG